MHIERTIEVDTSAVRAYRILADPTNIPRYAPDISDVAVTQITPRLVGTKMKLMTADHREMRGEVVEALAGRSCAFRTETGRTIRWQIDERDGSSLRLVNSIDTDEELDVDRIGPELDRKLRLLRNAFQAQRF